jgi:hypothetical protein
MYNPWQTATISKAMETRLKMMDKGIVVEPNQMFDSDLEEYKMSEEQEMERCNLLVESLIQDDHSDKNSKSRNSTTYASIIPSLSIIKEFKTPRSNIPKQQQPQEEESYRSDLCPHFLRGKCRFKKFCRYSHILSQCPYCQENLPLNRVSASAHLSRCWKKDGQDESLIFKRLTIHTLGQQD